VTDEKRISLDAMGGDFGVQVTVPAAVDVLRRRPDIRLVLVGDTKAIETALGRHRAGPVRERLEIQPASQVVEMDEPPSHALRSKKDSSMRVALNLVKEGRVDACVSAGNTGALMATARFVLKTLPGIDRPAILTAIPSIEGFCLVLDLGANVDSSAQHLFQFAVMGSVLANTVHGLAAPRVGLLNIGEEEIKGNEQVREAAVLLAGSPLNYIGFVEGDDVYKGGVDVVVCDGFVGNVALKSSEGVARMISHFLREEFNRNLLTRLAGLMALPVLNALRRRIDPRRYNGASLLGLRGIAVKSHGGADALAFANAIEVAASEAEHAVPERISAQLEQILSEKEAV